MYIIKRDGSTLPFETEKIANAIRKAMSKVNYEDTTNKADTIAQKVGTLFINKGLDTVPLEDVQDQVEVALMTDGLYNVAKEYILYRQQRSDVRVIKGKLNDTIKSLVDVTVDNDDKRENANIDAKSTMGTLLKVGTTVLKEFNLQTYCKEKHTENHRKGVWHEHDLDLGYIDINCVFIPLSRLLKNGFSTGHGFLRSPTSIRSASALTCIAIQSSQNDFFGGQAIPSLDFTLGVYVAKTYVRNFCKYLEIKYNFDTNYLKDIIIHPYDKIIDGLPEYKCTIREKIAADPLIKKIVESHATESSAPEFTDIIIFDACNYADKQTEEDTFQGMEAMVHNLCTMASRAGSQTPFSSVNFGLCTTWEGRLISHSLMKAIDKGLGHGETALFPIAIFKMKTGITDKGSVNYDLFQQACAVSSRRSYPNFVNVDAPFNLPFYKPEDPRTHVATMGCAKGDEVVIWKIGEEMYVSSFERMHFILSRHYEETRYSALTDYIHLENEKVPVTIWDSYTGKFVKVKNFIRNHGVLNWQLIKMDNGRNITVTPDHPLPVEDKGRTFAEDIIPGDEISKSTSVPVINVSEKDHEDKCSFNWLLGLSICDSVYAGRTLIIYLGPDELDIVEGVKAASMTLVTEFGGDIKVSHKLQERGKKGTYFEVSITGIPKLSQKLFELFGAVIKDNRHIPDNIFSKTTRKEKLAFLAGCIDADGYINDRRNTSRVQIGSTNKELAYGQAILAEMLGMPAKVYQNHYSKDRDYAIRYRVEFFATDELIDMLRSKKKRLHKGQNPGKPELNPLCAVSENIHITSPLYEASYDVETESDRFDLSLVQSHNCRTRVLNNYFDPENQITEGRGNLFWTTINLPYLALEIKDSLENVTYPDGYSKWVLLDAFFKRLDKVMEDVYDYSRDRFNVVAQRRAKNYPFMMGQREYVGSENLLPEDEIREVIKEGTISFGFIGLAETLVALIGKHHGESEEAQELGLKIIQFMKDKCDMWTKRDKFNYSVMASPAEGCTGRLLRCTRKRFGVIPGITDKEYFTNSFHVEVNYPITAYKKIDIEAPYHALCLAGSISYVELSEEAAKNIPAFEQLVTYIASKGCGYFSINHPLLRDPICGYSGPFNSDGSCPRCGRKEFEGVPAGKLFELTTYAPDPEYDIRGKLDEDDKVYHPLPEESETLES